MPTYSYNPENLNDSTMDRMRFELGDTIFAPGELTAALCDEEYNAIISRGGAWNYCKIKCLKAILMKYSHQVTMKVDGVSYNFTDRVKVWKDLLKRLEDETSVAVPTMNMLGKKEPHYFYNDMHANHRKDGF